MPPRLNKTQEKVVEEFGFSFVDEVPEVDRSRVSKYDAMWEAARNLCARFPNKPLLVRVHNNKSQAYEEAKKVNNGEKRLFKTDFAEWRAVAAPSNREDDVYPEDHELHGQRMTGVYLTYLGPQDENDTPTE
jgi:hypothetical protein